MKREWKKHSKRMLALLMAVALAWPAYYVQADAETEATDIEVTQLSDLKDVTDLDTSDSDEFLIFTQDYPKYYVGDAISATVTSKGGQSFQGVTSTTASTVTDDFTTYVVENTYNVAFLSYLKSLENIGWKQYSNNIADGVNLFATYTIDDDKDGTDDRSIYAYYIANKKTAYFVTSENFNFGNQTKSEYEAVTTPKLTQVNLKSDEYAQGMSYVLRLSDGRFIIVDGGFNAEGNPEQLYSILEKQNELDKITIAAWFITHPHKDHLGTAAGFLGKYTSETVKIEEMIFNFSTYADGDAVDKDTWSTSDDHGKSRVPTFLDNLALDTWNEVKIVTCHTGQKFYYADAEIEMLHTIEDYYPKGVDELTDETEKVNASSLVFSIDIAGQKILMTGDCSTVECADLVTMWGDYLKSDILQLPHHGQTDGAIELYELIDAEVVMIPAMSNAYRTIEAYASTKWVLNNTGGGIREVMLAGYALRELDLPYTPDEGTDYLSHSGQNGYILTEPELSDAEVPVPYMDMLFAGDAVVNAGYGNNTITMYDGSVGTNTVYYKGRTYSVPSYRAELNSGGYLQITMDDVANSESAVKDFYADSDGFAFEVFLALDKNNTSARPLMGHLATGGVALVSHGSSGVVNMYMGTTETQTDVGTDNGNYIYAGSRSTNNSTTRNITGGSIVSHLIGTYNPEVGKIQLYYNGALVAETEYDAENILVANTNRNSVGIGKNILDSSEILADMTGFTVLGSRIYDTYLTADEAAAEYWNCIAKMGAPVGADVDRHVTQLSGGGISKSYDIVPYRQDADKKTTSTWITDSYQDVTYYTKSPEAPDGYVDYIFAGWYADESCTKPLSDITVTSGTYYAKFVPKEILGVKAQTAASAGYVSSTGKLRFVTTVDSLDYNAVGFDVVIDGETASAQSDTVYRKLRASSESEGKTINYTPSSTFHAMSNYFLACTVGNIPNADFGDGYIATPYWITADGTKVSGETVVKSVNMGYVPNMIEATSAEAFTMAHKGTNSSAWYSSTTYAAQGICTDGTSYYQLESYVQNNLISSDTNAAYIRKYLISDGTVKDSGQLAISDANDITYNSINQTLVVACDDGENIYVVSPDELTILPTKSLPFAISAIAYNAFTDRYAVTMNNGQSFAILNADFEIVGGVYHRTDAYTGCTAEGLAADDSFIYLALSDENAVVVYDWAGNYKTVIKVPEIRTSDLSGICIYDNKIYLSSNNGNSTHVYTVSALSADENTDEPVATIYRDNEDKEYNSLASAMLDAETGETITVHQDITVASTMEMLAANVTITNAAGTNVTVKAAGSNTLLHNHAAGLKIQAAEGTTFTWEGNIINDKNKSLTLDDVTFTNAEAHSFTNYGTVTLSGAVSELIITEGAQTAIVKLDDMDTTNSDVTLQPTVATEHTVVSGSGISNVKLLGNMLEGAWYIDENGCLKSDACVTLTSNSTNYGSLADALEAAEENDTITVLKDFTLGESVVVNKTVTITSESGAVITRKTGFTGNMIEVSAGKITISKLTLDGNAGKTAEAVRAVKVAEGAELVMTDASVQNVYSSQSGAAIYSNGETVTLTNITFKNNRGAQAGAIHLNAKNANADCVLSIKDCIFDGNTSAKGLAGAMYLKAKGKTVDIQGTSYEDAYFTKNTNQSGEAHAFDVYTGTIVKVNGYQFNGHQAGLLTNDDTVQGQVDISGKVAGLSIAYSVKNTGVQITSEVDEESDVTLIPVSEKDGTYTENQKLVEVSNGYGVSAQILKVASDSTRAWAVSSEGYLVQDYCVQIGDTKYYSLAEAVNAASENAEIVILRDFTMLTPVTIDKSITITGNNHVITRGSALTGEMLHVTSGTLTIDNLTIDGAAGTKAVDVRAIKVASGATVTMSGGGIQNFYSNREGAGIAFRSETGTVTLSNVTISNVKSASDNSGGAIRNQNGTLTMTGCTVTGCSGGSDGGALYMSGSSANSFTNCTFENNAAKSRGGAIYYNGSTAIEISNCTFTGNTASNARGGALAVRSAKLTGCTFENNNVYLVSDSAMPCITLSGKVTGLSVTYTEDALGISLASDFDATNSGTITLVPHSYQSDIALVSGTIDTSKFTVEMANAIEDCTLTSEGKLAMYCVAIGDTKYTSLAEAVEAASDGATITILRDITLGATVEISKNITITSNDEVTITRATSMTGDMIHVKAGTVNVTGADGARIIIDGNKDENKAVEARAFEVNSGATLNMQYVTVENFNSTTNAVGVLSNGTTFLEYVEMSDITTSTIASGGVLRNEKAKMTIQNSSFTNITASGSQGGAIYVGGDANAATTISNTAFANNAAKRGGAIYYNSGYGTFSATGCTFTNNTATTDGGALLLKQGSLSDCTFVGETGNDVGLSNDTGYDPRVTLSGKIENLRVTFRQDVTSTAPYVEVGGAITEGSSITIVPNNYTVGTQVVKAATGVEANTLKAAIALMTVASDEETGDWVLKEDGTLAQYQAEVNGTKYAKLQDAITAANGSDVTILSSLTLTEAIPIDSTVVLKTGENGVKITRDAELTGDMFAVSANGSLTMTGSETAPIVIDGNAGDEAVASRAFSVAASGSLTLTYVTIQNFLANYSTNGGGIAIWNKGTTTLNHAYITNVINESSSAGGAIRNEAATLTVTDSQFVGNKVTGGNHGGAVYASGNSTIAIQTCEFSGNYAKRGGAFYYNDATADISIKNSTFEDNSAEEYAGAVAVRLANISDCTFGTNMVDEDDLDVYITTSTSTANKGITLSGELVGMTVKYNADTARISIGGTIDSESDITLVPATYTVGAQLVTKTDTLVDADGSIFKAATKLMKVASDEATGEWILMEDGKLAQYQAEVNGTKYTSLSAALTAAAEQGVDTVKLLADFTLSENITISDSVTLTSDRSVTITRDSSLTGNMFTVAAGATLTVQGAAADDEAGTEERLITIDGNAGTSASDTRAISVSAAVAADEEAGTEAKEAGKLVMEYAVIRNFYTNKGDTSSSGGDKGAGAAIYNAGTTTLTNVSITNAKCSNSCAGGSIRNQDGTLDMTDCVVSGGSNTGDGGALYTNNANVTLAGCTFEGNSAKKRGGAVYSNTTGIVIKDCIFTDNTVTDTTYSNAGAVAVNIATITGTTFKYDANTTGNEVYLIQSSSCVSVDGKNKGMILTPNAYTEHMQCVKAATDVSDADFIAATKNITVTQPADAVEGALPWGITTKGYLTQAVATIGETYYYSLSDAVDDVTSDDTISLQRSFTWYDNITLAEEKTVNIVNGTTGTVTITRNTTGDMITVNHASAVLNITGNEDSRNIVFEGGLGADDAGAVDVRCVEVTLGTFNLSNAAIQNFKSSRSGAGVAIRNCGTTDLNNVLLDGNSSTASSTSGGTLRNNNASAKLTMTDSAISNSSCLGDGGAIYSNGIVFNVERCTFDCNTASGQGGAVYVNGTNAAANTSDANEQGYGFIGTDCIFTNNTSGTQGGGLYVNTSGKAKLINSNTDTTTEGYYENAYFANNTAVNGGGLGVGNINVTLTVQGYSFAENKGTTNAGAVYNKGTYEDSNCYYYKNASGSGAGGAIRNNDTNSTLKLSGSLFYQNSSADDGGAIYSVGGGIVSATNCTFSENSAKRAAVYHNNTNYSESNSVYKDCVFNGNTFTSSGTIAAHLMVKKCTLTNCTFTNPEEATGVLYSW